MFFTGKLIGALLGSLAGPMGSILGGLMGHLLDRAVEESRLPQSAADLLEGSSRGDTVLGDVSQSQFNFLTTLIGLSAAVVAAVPGTAEDVSAGRLHAFLLRRFSFSEGERRLIRAIVDESCKNRERIHLEGLCRYFRSISSGEGRLLLLRLLFQAADADGAGTIVQEERVIQRIAGFLGVEEADYRSIASEFDLPAAGPYRVLDLQPGAGPEEVRRAYRRLARRYHPDRVASLGEEFVRVAEERFKTIRCAYEEISKNQGSA